MNITSRVTKSFTEYMCVMGDSSGSFVTVCHVPSSGQFGGDISRWVRSEDTEQDQMVTTLLPENDAQSLYEHIGKCHAEMQRVLSSFQ